MEWTTAAILRCGPAVKGGNGHGNVCQDCFEIGFEIDW